MIAIELEILGPGVHDGSQTLDQIEIALEISVGLRLADDRLPQQVQRESETLPAQSGKGL